MKKTLLALSLAFVCGWSTAALAEAPDGEAIYMKKCKVCHGADGQATKAGLKKNPNGCVF